MHPVERYFERALPMVGRYDKPLIRKQDVALDDVQLIRYSNTVKAEARRCLKRHVTRQLYRQLRRITA
ncbi:MAG: hypothetical protein LBJ02_00565 [Bifidobacteriaceae bacterium]|nr:hypothetical protein [Bifidobacteriaceae bacterium]